MSNSIALIGLIDTSIVVDVDALHDILSDVYHLLDNTEGVSHAMLSVIDNTISMFWNPANNNGSLDYLFINEIVMYIRGASHVS